MAEISTETLSGRTLFSSSYSINEHMRNEMPLGCGNSPTPTHAPGHEITQPRVNHIEHFSTITFSIMMWKKRAVQISITSHSNTSAASPQNNIRTNGVNTCNVKANLVLINMYAYFLLKRLRELASETMPEEAKKRDSRKLLESKLLERDN